MVFGSPFLIVTFGLCGHKATFEDEVVVVFLELRSSVKVEVNVLGSPSLIVHAISVDVKQHCRKGRVFTTFKGRLLFYFIFNVLKIEQNKTKAKQQQQHICGVYTLKKKFLLLFL